MARFLHLLCILVFLTGSLGIPVVAPDPANEQYALPDTV